MTLSTSPDRITAETPAADPILEAFLEAALEAVFDAVRMADLARVGVRGEDMAFPSFIF